MNCIIYSQPPSDKWAKEVKIGTGLCDNRPIVIEEKDRVLVAYEGSDKVVISVLNLDGTIINSNEFEKKEHFLKT